MQNVVCTETVAPPRGPSPETATQLLAQQLRDPMIHAQLAARFAGDTPEEAAQLLEAGAPLPPETFALLVPAQVRQRVQKAWEEGENDVDSVGSSECSSDSGEDASDAEDLARDLFGGDATALRSWHRSASGFFASHPELHPAVLSLEEAETLAASQPAPPPGKRIRLARGVVNVTMHWWEWGKGSFAPLPSPKGKAYTNKELRDWLQRDDVRSFQDATAVTHPGRGRFVSETSREFLVPFLTQKAPK